VSVSRENVLGIYGSSGRYPSRATDTLVQLLVGNYRGILSGKKGSAGR
jgi:hypothetical protein